MPISVTHRTKAIHYLHANEDNPDVSFVSIITIVSSSISHCFAEDKLNSPSEATAGTIEHLRSGREGNDPAVLVHNGRI
jgi:hypothetical protein